MAGAKTDYRLIDWIGKEFDTPFSMEGSPVREYNSLCLEQFISCVGLKTKYKGRISEYDLDFLSHVVIKNGAGSHHFAAVLDSMFDATPSYKACENVLAILVEKTGIMNNVRNMPDNFKEVFFEHAPKTPDGISAAEVQKIWDNAKPEDLDELRSGLRDDHDCNYEKILEGDKAKAALKEYAKARRGYRRYITSLQREHD